MTSQGLFSIGGIASGLDTAAIVDQLMALERVPVTRIESTQAGLRRVDQAWSQVNTKLSALRDAVDRIRRTDRFDGLVAVTSSDTDVATVERGTGSQVGSLSFRVTQLAQAHQVASGTVAGDDTTLDAGTFSVTVGGTTTTVEVAEGTTLTQLASQLTAARGGFTAAAIEVADGQHRLMLTSHTTGAATTLQVDTDVAQLGGAFGTVAEGRDALLQLGTGDGAITVARASNTVTDLVPGATITLRRVSDTPVTVTSARDVDAGVAAVREYVAALNDVIGLLADQTRYDAASGTAGVLQGESSARRLLDDLRAAAAGSNVAGGTIAAAGIGLSVDRAGAVVLDEDRLRAILAEDFSAVGRVLAGTTDAPGLAAGLSATLATAEGVSGIVARARNGITSRIKIYQDRIDGFEQRLASREVTLRRQFTAMETALQRLNSQGNWLAGQLNQLNNLNAQR